MDRIRHDSVHFLLTQFHPQQAVEQTRKIAVLTFVSQYYNSFEKVKPGINPRFFNQNIEQKLPEKNISSTQAKASKRSANDSEPSIHQNAHLAFCCTRGMVSTA
ncbi:Uncharacterized protein Adt_47206 [Abeliophyllum distichum]|uniref:Uncharacterized protein n=1 Tax=Abeliophyllum distichum TaxID=126358 RepID=A0ABD1NVE1_9LAMI